MEKLRLSLKSDQLKGEVNLSGSKSISNRLLIMSQLAGSIPKFKNLSLAEDTTRLIKILQQIETCSSSRIPLIIDAGNVGTVLRFLTAYLSIKQGKWLLTGEERMKNRPVGGLVEALNELGADINFAEKKSPTFGSWVGEHLSAENFKQLWIPEGFGHAFVVLSENAEFLYRTTDFWAPEHERCIIWNDPELNVSWPIDFSPTLSDKDVEGLLFKNADIYE